MTVMGWWWGICLVHGMKLCTVAGKAKIRNAYGRQVRAKNKVMVVKLYVIEWLCSILRFRRTITFRLSSPFILFFLFLFFYYVWFNHWMLEIIYVTDFDFFSPSQLTYLRILTGITAWAILLFNWMNSRRVCGISYPVPIVDSDLTSGCWRMEKCKMPTWKRRESNK